MFTLNVLNDKLAKMKELLNAANITSRVDKTNQDPTITVLTFKKQEELDQATQLLATI